MRFLLATLILAFPAHADTSYVWKSGRQLSTVTLEPTTAPGAVAQVRFENKTVHADEAVTFVLDLEGVSVTVDALVGRGLTPDRMTVTPPDGFIAVPSELDVNEDALGVILILPFLGY